MHSHQHQRVVEKEAETERKRAIIEAEKVVRRAIPGPSSPLTAPTPASRAGTLAPSLKNHRWCWNLFQAAVAKINNEARIKERETEQEVSRINGTRVRAGVGRLVCTLGLNRGLGLAGGLRACR
jgi:hypothetical protein